MASGPPAGGMILGAVQDALQRRMQRGLAADQEQLARDKMADDSQNAAERNAGLLEKIRMQGEYGLANRRLQDESAQALKAKDLENWGTRIQSAQKLAEIKQAHELEKQRVDAEAKAARQAADNASKEARQNAALMHDEVIKRYVTAANNASGVKRAEIMAAAKNYAADMHKSGMATQMSMLLAKGDIKSEQELQRQIADADIKNKWYPESPGPKAVTDRLRAEKDAVAKRNEERRRSIPANETVVESKKVVAGPMAAGRKAPTFDADGNVVP